MNDEWNFILLNKEKRPDVKGPTVHQATWEY